LVHSTMRSPQQFCGPVGHTGAKNGSRRFAFHEDTETFRVNGPMDFSGIWVPLGLREMNGPGASLALALFWSIRQFGRLCPSGRTEWAGWSHVGKGNGCHGCDGSHPHLKVSGCCACGHRQFSRWSSGPDSPNRSNQGPSGVKNH
jgi:hypothetical protein